MSSRPRAPDVRSIVIVCDTPLCSTPTALTLSLTIPAAAEGVRRCDSLEAARSHFEMLVASQRLRSEGGAEAGRKTGNANERPSSAGEGEVVLQECLRGVEYVVDCVSRDGEHKVLMLWKYDKRPANGADFVYFGERPLDSGSEARAAPGRPPGSK